MGAYLGKPITEKESIDDFNDFLVCGASSMQGWRNSQEDAHNCILNYDENGSFFAVYDGHGGSEVAIYCSKYLPNLLKELSEYKEGNFEQALQKAFLDIDANLLKPEVIAELKQIAMANEDSDAEKEDEEEGLVQLCREGKMPLAAVLEKYKAAEMKKHLSGGGGGDDEENLDELYKESQMPLEDVIHKYQDKGESETSSNDKPGSSKNDAEPACSSSSKSADKNTNDEISSSSCAVNSNETSASPDCSSTTSIKSESNHVDSSSTGVTSGGSSKNTSNGIASDSGISSSLSVGEGKNSSSDDKADVPDTPNSSSNSPPKNMPVLGQKAKRTSAPKNLKDTEQDSSDESEDDEEFDGKADEWEDIEDDEEDDDDDEEEDDDDDTEDEDDEELDDEDEDAEENSEFIENIVEEPGNDSGCTAVVAVLKGLELYVANAGDSRCVVCRDGEALEMSIDHKPEDEPEHKRIKNAGGRVTVEGRVNGGLNLSRAIGDHGYKTNEKLKPEEQMISALPDIKHITLTEKDSFMILACDGIWNSLTSQAVCDFIKERLNKHEKLSQICEEMFETCLAPNTFGDGTGCDNMTAIIVKFKHASNGKMEIDDIKSASTVKTAAKRPATTDVEKVDETIVDSNKRVKTEELTKTESDENISSSDAVTTSESSVSEMTTDPPVTSSS